MIERVLGHLADHGIEEAVLSLGYRPDAFIGAYPERDIAGVRLTYAVEPTPLDTAGAIGFAAGHAGIDETFVVVNGDVLTDVDLTEPGRLPPLRRGGGDHRAHPGRRPERLRRGADRRRRTGAGVHREAAPRRGPDQSDQRRDLRARTGGARTASPRTAGCRSSGRRSRPWSKDGTLFARAPMPTGWTPARRTPTCGPTATCSTGAAPARPPRGRELDPGLGPGVWRVGEVDVDGGSVARSLWSAGASVARGASVDDRWWAPGAVVEEGLGDRLGAPPRARVASRATVEGHSVDRPGGHRRPAVRRPRASR